MSALLPGSRSCRSAAAGQRRQHVEALVAHHRQLEIWAANCPDNFENRTRGFVGHTEIAAGSGRPRSSRPSVCTRKQSNLPAQIALSTTRRSRTRLRRGSTRRAASRPSRKPHLRNARYCYLRWGAEGKVRQLDQRDPWLREESTPSPSTAMFGAPVEQLDIGSVVKASQAVSGRDQFSTGSVSRNPDDARGSSKTGSAPGAMAYSFSSLRGDTPQIEAEAKDQTGRRSRSRSDGKR